MERNFKANANSKNPKTTFTVFIQLPDLGITFRVLGNKAKRPNGKPNATPKPSIPKESCVAPPTAVIEPASREPRIGPVQEKETIASVSAIKKIPIIPFIAEAWSDLFPHVVGKVIS